MGEINKIMIIIATTKSSTFGQIRRCEIDTGNQQRRQDTRMRMVTLAALIISSDSLIFLLLEYKLYSVYENQKSLKNKSQIV